MKQAEERETLYCSCHGTLIMAKRNGRKLIVLKTKSGREHTLIYDLAAEHPAEDRTEVITYGYGEMTFKPIDPERQLEDKTLHLDTKP